MAGEHLDLTSDPFDGNATSEPRAIIPHQRQAESAGQSSRANSKDGRRFVGVTFACCDIYARIYINKHETAYEGRCPRCCKPVCMRIGPGGVDARFFTAY
jgi:hypothetical protein